jgi:lipopolysaccharide export system protein LptA
MHPHNTKALTPMLSSGILICIAIAVSLATLAWMNGLPTPDMQPETLQLTNCQWETNLAYVDVTLHNNGTQNVQLKSVTVNSQPATVVYIAGSNQINNGETAVLRIAHAFTPQETYQLKFQTAKGNKFTYTATPQPSYTA